MPEMTDCPISIDVPIAAFLAYSDIYPTAPLSSRIYYSNMIAGAASSNGQMNLSNLNNRKIF